MKGILAKGKIHLMHLKITKCTTEGKTTKLVGDPNATWELTIRKGYADFGEYGKDTIVLAIDKYKELYPNVKVCEYLFEYESDEQYEGEIQKLKTEAWLGKIPIFSLPMVE